MRMGSYRINRSSRVIESISKSTPLRLIRTFRTDFGMSASKINYYPIFNPLNNAINKLLPFCSFDDLLVDEIEDTHGCVGRILH